MNQGGYDLAGQAGGFRQNIRDADRQRQLEEQERIVKTEETLDRVVRANEEEYRSRPDDPASTMKYAKSLMERGRPEDEKRALEVLKRGLEVTKQFRFREMQGDLILRMAARKLAKYRETAAAAPENAKAQSNYKLAQAEYLRMEVEEYKARVEAYPTDLGLKFELGKRLFEGGNTDGAIALFQESQHDAKRRVESLNYLGQAFMKIGWTDEAVHTFRQAMDTYKLTTDETGMALRFGLLSALQTKAEADRDLAVAEEADKLASAIAVQQFNYRDIRTRRDALKKLIGEIKRGDPVT
jgi:predicted Zn-dependent protease